MPKKKSAEVTSVESSVGTPEMVPAQRASLTQVEEFYIRKNPHMTVEELTDFLQVPMELVLAVYNTMEEHTDTPAQRIIKQQGAVNREAVVMPPSLAMLADDITRLRPKAPLPKGVRKINENK